MNIRQELKDEINADKTLNEIDEKRQMDKIRLKKRKDDLEFYREISRLMEAF